MKKATTLYIFFLALSISTQAQITWTTGMNIASSTYDNMHPRIVTDASGNPLVIWGRMSDESVFFSRWNGAAFTTPVKLNGTLTVATASWMGPDIASRGDTVYVVFKQTPEGDTTSHVRIVRSFDGGMTFSSPVQVDNIGDSISRFPTVTINDSGNPVVGFMKFNSTFGDARWVVTKSSDYGNTFSTDTKASGWSSFTSTVCDCCPGGIVSSGNNVAMLYRDNNNNIRDSWVGLSTDGAISFTSGWSIDQHSWMIMACPATGPDGVIIGDSLYSVFMNGAGGSRVYKSVSSLSGMFAQPYEMLTGSITGLNSQNYPRIDRYGNAMAIVWKQNVSGADQLPILFTNDISVGFPSIYDTVDFNDITNADVALSNGNIFVVWQDDNSGTVKYRKGTFSLPANINENSLQNLSLSPNPLSDFLNIDLQTAGNATLTITNALGQQIFSSVISALKNKMQLNTSEWKPGIYFITLKTTKRISTKRIVVQHL